MVIFNPHYYKENSCSFMFRKINRHFSQKFQKPYLSKLKPHNEDLYVQVQVIQELQEIVSLETFFLMKNVYFVQRLNISQGPIRERFSYHVFNYVQMKESDRLQLKDAMTKLLLFVATNSSRKKHTTISPVIGITFDLRVSNRRILVSMSKTKMNFLLSSTTWTN